MKKSKIFLATAIIFANLTFSATAALAENNTQNNLATTENNSAVKNVSVAEAVDLINNKNAVIIDVRTPEEFAASHLPNANNFPVDTLSENTEAIRAFLLLLKTTNLQQDKPILVYCRSGKRAARATEILKNLGVNSVHNLKGGIKAWSDANNPLAKE